MKRSAAQVWSRRALPLLAAGGVLAPLLATYLFIGTCGGGKSGVVVAFKGWHVEVTAAWCAARPAPPAS